MKIYNCVRDAKLMELAELQAVDKRARAVQSNIQFNEPEQSAPEAEETVKAPKKARAKKKKEGV